MLMLQISQLFNIIVHVKRFDLRLTLTRKGHRFQYMIGRCVDEGGDDVASDVGKLQVVLGSYTAAICQHDYALNWHKINGAQPAIE